MDDNGDGKQQTKIDLTEIQYQIACSGGSRVVEQNNPCEANTVLVDFAKVKQIGEVINFKETYDARTVISGIYRGDVEKMKTFPGVQEEGPFLYIVENNPGDLKKMRPVHDLIVDLWKATLDDSMFTVAYRLRNVWDETTKKLRGKIEGKKFVLATLNGEVLDFVKTTMDFRRLFAGIVVVEDGTVTVIDKYPAV